MKFNLKDMAIVGDLMAQADNWLLVKTWITIKVKAIQLKPIFESLKDKEKTEKEFYQEFMEDRFEEFVEELKKENPDTKFEILVFMDELETESE